MPDGTVDNVEFETPVKGPKQVHKLLPRPVGARPGVQKPPMGVNTPVLLPDVAADVKPARRSHRSEADVAHLLETCRRLRRDGYHKQADTLEAAI